MTRGAEEKPISPTGVPGPFKTPESCLVEAVTKGNIESFHAGAETTRQALGETKGHGRSSIPRWAIVIYAMTLVFAIIVFAFPGFSDDYKNKAFGYILGQAPLLFSSLGSNKES